MTVEHTATTVWFGRWQQVWALNRRHLRQVWTLSKPWFSSEQRWQARGLLLAIVVLNLALVYMNVLFNDWYRLFYDALQEKNEAVFWHQLLRFGMLASVFVVIAVYKFYVGQVMEVRWRTWMTERYLGRWLSHRAFYHLELARFSQTGAGEGNPDNPDQRIQEDIRQFTHLTLGLGTGLLNAVVTLLSFVGILWTLSGGFGFHVMGTEYVIAGFMVWMALLYCVVGSLLTHYIGRPQIGLNFQQQQLEAHFRHRMVRVREYSESIALEQGNANEHGQLGLRFGNVVRNYLALIAAQKRLVWFTSFFDQAAVVFPFLVAAPRFFSGAIQLGELIQISSAFRQVQEALSWFVDNYQELATWRATTNRLTGFEAALQTLPQQAGPRQGGNTTGTDGSDHVLPTRPGGRNLRITLPDGTVLLTQTDLELSPGRNILLTGPSGSGKSTLFRTLAGIWPWATGQVQRAEDCLFLPQRAYIPEGSLRDALTYPKAPDTWSDATLAHALRDALLPDLADQLDVSAAWSQKLSGGEQQRLAIARALLQQPQWIFADEATSALDPDAEATLYQRLFELVARRGGGLVSIAHRATIARFHHCLWVLEPQASGSEARFKLHEKPLVQA